MWKTLFLIGLGMAWSFAVCGQNTAVKTNLLYDATSTLNLGVEWGLAPKWTLDISASYNPWEFGGNRKMKHWLVQPEARYWLCEKFSGHFFGVHLHGGQYNWGNMFSLKKRYQGWFTGGGISYGHQWILNNRWSLEATIGLGYAYLNYDRYPCTSCGKKISSGHKNYLGPTKAGITLIYMIK